MKIVRTTSRRRGKHVDLGAGVDQRGHDVVMAAIERRHQRRFAGGKALAREKKIVGEHGPHAAEIAGLDELDQPISVAH
jgi:hypothetical protein